jgi:hypothetical protein
VSSSNLASLPSGGSQAPSVASINAAQQQQQQSSQQPISLDNFVDFANSSNTGTVNVAAAKVAAAAAVAANQYINASLNAAVSANGAASSSNQNAAYKYTYHHFDWSKQGLAPDYRHRAVGSANAHYANLSSHLPYTGK